MKRLNLLLFTCCLICACETQQATQNENYGGKNRETVSNKQEENNIAEIRPQLAQMSVAARTSLTKKEISNPGIRGVKVESLQLWSDGDQWPVMLEVNYPVNATHSKAVYYFRERKLIAVEKTGANFTFRKNKLQVWADENWQPLKDKTTDQWMDQENYLLNNTRIYLKVFEINYED